MIKQYNFHKTKYGDELLIDLILLEDLQPYITENPTHSLTYYDITIISNGQGTFSVDQQNNPIETGRVFFTSPGQVRRWDFDIMPHGYVLIFEEEFLCRFFNDPLFVQNLLYFSDNATQSSIALTKAEYNQLKPLLLNIKDEIYRYKVKDEHILRAILYQVLMLLSRMYNSHSQTLAVNHTNRYIHKFTHLVNANYQQNRSVEFYAQQLNITSGHLNNLVKQSLGFSAKHYILNRTLLEAKRLLCYTSLSVDEIAQYLNFDNTSYFVRLFHKNAGETPLQFRKAKIHEK
jgi:AraC-like DNA-binding protein